MAGGAGGAGCVKEEDDEEWGWAPGESLNLIAVRRSRAKERPDEDPRKEGGADVAVDETILTEESRTSVVMGVVVGLVLLLLEVVVLVTILIIGSVVAAELMVVVELVTKLLVVSVSVTTVAPPLPLS